MTLKTPHHTQIKLAAKCGLTISIETLSNGEQYVLRMADGSIRTSGSDLKALLADATGQNIGGGAPRSTKPKKARKATKRRVRKDEDDEDEDDKSGSVVKAKYKARYNANKVVKGTCGDEFAVAFTDECRDEDGDIDMASVFRVAKDNDVSLTKYRRSGRGWEGRIRMTLGNILRGMRRHGTDIKIGKNTFKGVPQKAKAE